MLKRWMSKRLLKKVMLADSAMFARKYQYAREQLAQILLKSKNKKNIELVTSCATDVGNVREENQDRVLTIHNSEDKNITLIAVANGIGGRNCGSTAAQIAINCIQSWFKNLSSSELNDTLMITKQLTEWVREVDQIIFEGSQVKEIYKGMGTTLSVALINKRHTIVVNVGNSRMYVSKKKIITQVTEDDSVVWNKCCKTGRAFPDDLRFANENNIITKCLGSNMEKDVFPRIYILNNNEYDCIYGMSDGAYELYSNSELISTINDGEFETSANRIVDGAKKGSTKTPNVRHRIIFGNEVHSNNPGQDNISCVGCKQKRLKK